MDSTLKKEFLINGQGVKVSLRKCWTRYEKGKKYNGDCIKSIKGLIGFFVFDGKIFVFINTNVFDVDDVKISNQLIGKYRIFTITVDGKILFKKKYRAKTGYDLNYFYPTEEEDVDHFLWMSNVLNDAGRRKVILKYQVDSKVA